MNIDHIKNKVKEYMGYKLRIKVSLGRNKYEYYEGYIDKMHPNVFIVKTDKGVKSFSYSDIVVKSVILTKSN